MAEVEEKNALPWPGGASKVENISEFEFLMCGNDDEPILKIEKQKLNEFIVVNGEGVKAVAGGATSSSPTILRPGPTGQNRKMEDVEGWFVNGTADEPPVAVGDPWEAPAGFKNVNWWDGIAGTWSLGSSVELPKDPVNGVPVPNNENATSGDTVYKYSARKDQFQKMANNESFNYAAPVPDVIYSDTFDAGKFVSSNDGMLHDVTDTWIDEPGMVRGVISLAVAVGEVGAFRCFNKSYANAVFVTSDGEVIELSRAGSNSHMYYEGSSVVSDKAGTIYVNTIQEDDVYAYKFPRSEEGITTVNGKYINKSGVEVVSTTGRFYKRISGIAGDIVAWQGNTGISTSYQSMFIDPAGNVTPVGQSSGSATMSFGLFTFPDQGDFVVNGMSGTTTFLGKIPTKEVTKTFDGFAGKEDINNINNIFDLGEKLDFNTPSYYNISGTSVNDTLIRSARIELKKGELVVGKINTTSLDSSSISSVTLLNKDGIFQQSIVQAKDHYLEKTYKFSYRATEDCILVVSDNLKDTNLRPRPASYVYVFRADTDKGRTLLQSVQKDYDLTDNSSKATTTYSDSIDESVIGQEYMGMYMEIQPDSWDGTVPSVSPNNVLWGFPQSLTKSEQARVRFDLLPGNGRGIQFIRFPLGFAYRGYRNIDPVSNLARNIGERYKGQNTALKRLFQNIAEAGGGLATEYWCPPVHWLTSGTYNATGGANEITAGGTYPRRTTLESIRESDPTQYAAQVDAFSSAILDDYEYLHTNIAPVRMFCLQNEPDYGTQPYGACRYTPNVYADVLYSLYNKVMASPILRDYNGENNTPLLYIGSSDQADPWAIVGLFAERHPELVWGYSHHQSLRRNDANFYLTQEFKDIKGDKQNVFNNEFEYFSPTATDNNYKFGNTVLAMINNIVHGGAKVLAPLIHIFKQLGQTSAQTNTDGYALLQCNLPGEYGVEPNNAANPLKLEKGTYGPVSHNYNAYKMFADNLPIGSVRIGNVLSNPIDDVSYVCYRHQGRLFVFIINRKATYTKVELTFGRNIRFSKKRYSMYELGIKLPDSIGTTSSSVVAPWSGEVWIEELV